MHGFPAVLVEGKVAEWPARLGAGGLGQHLGQFGNTGTMAAGVGALGVDGRRDELDESLEQGFLGMDQATTLDRVGRIAGQGFDETQAGEVGFLPAEQHDGAEH